VNPPTATVLETIVARTRERLAERRRLQPIEELRARPAPPHRSFAGALARPRHVNVIAEHKRRSPSRGPIREDLVPASVFLAYQDAGAAALSVLTDEDFFGGHLSHLEAARDVSRLPLLRKDFVVDAYQVWEARAAGADAVLLIVAALDEADLRTLLAESRSAGLDALVEVHDRHELDRALKAGARVVGANNRDLKTLAVTLDTALSLSPHIPDDVVAVAESGIRTGADIRRLRDAGYDAFLVGEHLMSAPEPGGALRALIEAAQ
jgi:indole-3-glycerol phosphate synthase